MACRLSALGLCASDGLSLEGAVGGAYHPAMGELVQGGCTEERSKPSSFPPDISDRDSITIEVPRGAVSTIGNGGRNRADIQSKFNIKSLKTFENPRLKSIM